MPSLTSSPCLLLPFSLPPLSLCLVCSWFFFLPLTFLLLHFFLFKIQGEALDIAQQNTENSAKVTADAIYELVKAKKIQTKKNAVVGATGGAVAGAIAGGCAGIALGPVGAVACKSFSLHFTFTSPLLFLTFRPLSSRSIFRSSLQWQPQEQ
jgi:uncharacterized protein YqgC (DUF456 family)